MVKAGRTINYEVLHLTRIVGPDWTLTTLPGVTPEAESVPAFSADELADVV